MTLQDYVEDIKLVLTGGLLELEIPDENIGKVVMKCLREIQRYIDVTKFITIPYAGCIDMKEFNCSSVTAVYRTQGFMDSTSMGMSDPMYAQQWLIFSSGGTMYNLQNYLLNFMAYNTFSQIRNTTSTDLDFKEVKEGKEHKLYINVSYDIPTMITVEYVPKIYDVEDITSDYWIDILERLSLAQTKVILGRIRSKYKQSNALWTLDGDQLLEEGNTELENLRETLRVNSQLFTPID